MAKNDFQYGGWNSYTLQCGMWLWNRDSEFTKWQNPAMWYVADLRHLGFYRGPIMGSLKSPCATSYRSSIDTVALNCLVFEKIAFFCILATDRQTDKQMDIIDAWSCSLAVASCGLITQATIRGPGAKPGRGSGDSVPQKLEHFCK